MKGQCKNLGKTVTPNEILMHTLQSLIRVTPFALVRDWGKVDESVKQDMYLIWFQPAWFWLNSVKKQMYGTEKFAEPWTIYTEVGKYSTGCSCVKDVKIVWSI